MSIRNRITHYIASVLSTRIYCTQGGILLGRKTTGAGYSEEITIGTGLELTVGKVLNATAVGATNLTATASPTTVVVGSDTGTDATIAAASGSNAGLLLPTEKTLIGGIPALTFAGSDPNSVPTGVLLDGSGDARIDGKVLVDAGVDVGGRVWSESGTHSYASGEVYLIAQDTTAVDIRIEGSSDAWGDFTVGSVEDTPWAGGPASPYAGFAEGDVILTEQTSDGAIATHLGQWCKASTAWWQWDGTAWIPRFTLQGKPITRDDADTAYFALGVDAIGLVTSTPFP